MKLAHQPVPSNRHSHRAAPVLSIFAQKSRAKHRAVTTFRINTSISAASKRIYLSLESTLMKKGGEGGDTPGLDFSRCPAEHAAPVYRQQRRTYESCSGHGPRDSCYGSDVL